MPETNNFKLPLLAPSQAQKHVTINEALARLDALAQLRVASADIALPPVSAIDGTCYIVAAGATGLWTGKDQQIAIRSNGGWTFAEPQTGWCAWDSGFGLATRFDGTNWIRGAVVHGGGGAATLARAQEFDHVIAAGATSITTVQIPSHAQVLAVTARVIEAIAGSGMTSFSIGVAADPVRYGSGIGLGLNAYAKGITGSPVSYYADTALVLSADVGSFASGRVRLAVHLLEVTPPREI